MILQRLMMIAILWTFIVSVTMLFGGSFVLGIFIAASIQLAIQLFASPTTNK